MKESHLRLDDDLLLFILLGILYLLLYNTTKRVIVTAYPLPEGGFQAHRGWGDSAAVTAMA